MDMNFKHFQIESKKFVTNDQKIICDFQIIKYHNKKNMKIIILNEYMQNIYWGFNEIWNYITKGVKENHYDYNILKNVMW